MSRRILGAGTVVLGFVLLVGCASQGGVQPISNGSPTSSDTPLPLAENTYNNTQYRFTFTLPSSWTGYRIVNSTWQGWNSATGKIVQTGPLLTIRHPSWRVSRKSQDIPILIYTLDQWSALGLQVFNMGAAPIGPDELGRNAQYVFALPARYNWAFLMGYQEVEQILRSKPLRAY